MWALEYLFTETVTTGFTHLFVSWIKDHRFCSEENQFLKLPQSDPFWLKHQIKYKSFKCVKWWSLWIQKPKTAYIPSLCWAIFGWHYNQMNYSLFWQGTPGTLWGPLRVRNLENQFNYHVLHPDQTHDDRWHLKYSVFTVVVLTQLLLFW